MTSFLVKLSDSAPSKVLENGSNAVVVEAEDAADAKIMAEFASKIDGADWAGADVTTIAAPSDMLGWKVRVVVIDPAAAADVAPLGDFTYTGIASDVLDDMGTALAALVNAAAAFTSIYTTATQLLQVAAIGDGIGDHLVLIGFFPPGADTTLLSGEIGGVAGFVASVVDEGIAAAVLTATFAADAHVVPSVPILVKA